MQYSPKLKMVMAEIKQLLESNDIAGVVILHTPGFTEYLNHVTPSYSCMTYESGGLRVRVKSAEVGVQRARELQEGTYNMVTHLASVLTMLANGYVDLGKHLTVKWGGFGDEGRHTSSFELDN